MIQVQIGGLCESEKKLCGKPRSQDKEQEPHPNDERTDLKGFKHGEARIAGKRRKLKIRF
jgi:hypothetical protein